MTDPTNAPGQPAPGMPPAQPPLGPGVQPPPGALPTDPRPMGPPPAPVPVRPAGFGGPRVPAVLVAILGPVLAIVIFAAGVAAGGPGGPLATGPLEAGTTTPRPSGAPVDLGLVDEAWRVIHDNYVDPGSLSDQELVYGAIRGMTDSVGDEGHTSFMTADEAKASDQSLSGTFVGIGIQVSEADAGGVQITTVFPDTPAERAGLQRGDRIVAVDGTSTVDETVEQVVTRVRGPEGEDVTLTIARGDAPDFEVTITRRQFDLPLVSWAMVPGTKVAMIRLDQFATGATDALKSALEAAKGDGATGIVFDLRANPGGYVNEAVGVASQFLSDGIVYQSYDRSGERQDAKVEPGGVATDIPLVVLANGDTASSAEIVSGAIQDAGRGEVVGEKTFGTGTVLGRFDLSDGSVLRIGVERWLTRAGRPIWHEGLEPDVEVPLAADAQPTVPDSLRDMTAAEFRSSADAQLKRAVELLETGR